MEIISFSKKPSPFPPVPLSKIPVAVLKQAALDVRKNKPKQEKVVGK